MDIRNFGFSDEAAFVETAAIDRRVYANFRTYIEAVAGSEVDRLLEEPRSSTRLELIEAAMTPFDRAFQKYQRGKNGEPHDFAFSAYYRWWARQYALTFETAQARKRR